MIKQYECHVFKQLSRSLDLTGFNKPLISQFEFDNH